MQFVKVHGCGNDFVLVPDLQDRVRLTPDMVRALCARHHGIGGDGVIRVGGPITDDADVFMDYRNADGSVVETCGNGLRCVAKYVLDRGLVKGDSVRVGSRAGTMTVEVAGRHSDRRVARLRVDMGTPTPTGVLEIDVSPLRTVPHDQEVQVAVDAALRRGSAVGVVAVERRVSATTLSMGNPHAVIVVDDLEGAPVAVWGPSIEHDPAFPHGTNVEFITVPGRNRVRGRVWERGVGETLASGTGGAAMAVAAHLRGLADRRVHVDLPGGTLEVDWTERTLYVTGPAEEVCVGTIDRDWLRAAEAPKGAGPGV